MIQQPQKNPCIRCGKDRITVDVHKEKIGGSLVTSTKTACPDSECQALVDLLLEKERLQRERLVNMNQQHVFRRGRKKTKNIH